MIFLVSKKIGRTSSRSVLELCKHVLKLMLLSSGSLKYSSLDIFIRDIAPRVFQSTSRLNQICLYHDFGLLLAFASSLSLTFSEFLPIGRMMRGIMKMRSTVMRSSVIARAAGAEPCYVISMSCVARRTRITGIRPPLQWLYPKRCPLRISSN